jgi:hypothetical protein
MVDSVLRQLREQGFDGFEVKRTFLGRIHIEAESDEYEREIVINPRSGEVLRDYVEPRDSDDRTPKLLRPSSQSERERSSDRSARSNDDRSESSGSGSDRDDTDDRDDRDDSDDRDDRDDSDDRDDDRDDRDDDRGDDSDDDD